MVILHSVLSVPFITCVAILGTFILSVVVWLKSLLKTNRPKSNFFYKDSALASHLLRKCKLLHKPFSPLMILGNAHVQSVLPALFPTLLPCQGVDFDREYLQLKDKGVVALDWAKVTECRIRNRSPILLIIPAITENALSLSRMCKVSAKANFRPVVFNRRGHGGSYLTTPKLQSLGDPSDLRQVIKYITGKFPKAIITATAFGTGCSLLLSYLGEFGSSASIYAGVCISPCFDTAERFGDSIRNVYDIAFLYKLKTVISQHSVSLSKNIDIHKALASWRYDTFNEHLYHKIYSYYDKDDFWERNNPLRDVDDIAVPVLCINSMDDPFYGSNNIPYDLFKVYPNFFLVATEKGGHCGFLEGCSINSWAEHLSVEYLQAVLEFTMKGYKTIKKKVSRSTI